MSASTPPNIRPDVGGAVQGDGTLEYEWFANLDARACLVCLAMDGTTHWLTGAEVAERAAGRDHPDWIVAGAHRHCRCMLGRVGSEHWHRGLVARRLMQQATGARNPYRPQEAR